MSVTTQQIEVLELAAQTESLLSLYQTAKRELHVATGINGVDVAKFPIVETVRQQIKTVRNSIGKGGQ